MQNESTIIPEGYMQDSQGRLVPKEMVKEIDQQRDSIVREIVNKAKGVAGIIKDFKVGAMGDIEAFVELSAERFDVKLGGAKGNLTITSYDGAYRIVRAIDEYIVFDERLQVAKALIDECIHEWAEGSSNEIRVLINDAFQVDKQGKVNVRRILSLRRLEIRDQRWQKAMAAIGESIQVTGSKTYLRIYERQNDGSYKQLALDVAA